MIDLQDMSNSDKINLAYEICPDFETSFQELFHFLTGRGPEELEKFFALMDE